MTILRLLLDNIVDILGKNWRKTSHKSHLLLNNQGNNVLKMGSFSIKNPLPGKSLDISVDYNLKFNIHTKDICKKTSSKLNALARLTPCIGLYKCWLLKHAFLKKQFN